MCHVTKAEDRLGVGEEERWGWTQRDSQIRIAQAGRLIEFTSHHCGELSTRRPLGEKNSKADDKESSLNIIC